MESKLLRVNIFSIGSYLQIKIAFHVILGIKVERNDASLPIDSEWIDADLIVFSTGCQQCRVDRFTYVVSEFRIAISIQIRG